MMKGFKQTTKLLARLRRMRRFAWSFAVCICPMAHFLTMQLIHSGVPEQDEAAIPGTVVFLFMTLTLSDVTVVRVMGPKWAMMCRSGRHWSLLHADTSMDAYRCESGWLDGLYVDSTMTLLASEGIHQLVCNIWEHPLTLATGGIWCNGLSPYSLD